MTDNLVIAKKERLVLHKSIDKFINKIKSILKDCDPGLLDLEETLEQLNSAEIKLKWADADIKKLI